ncbi:MAG: hypothetical protein GF355_09475 [Candidatus Eisenbacteria bacterium]|nr:hypothetical protein [Candidatus Eisenbacteria bacterium]
MIRVEDIPRLWRPAPVGRPTTGLTGWHPIPNDAEPIVCQFVRYLPEPETGEEEPHRCEDLAVWAHGTGIRDRFYCSQHKSLIKRRVKGGKA